MTQTSLFKKAIAVIISVLMILTSLPLTAFARESGLADADPYWTEIASSNFNVETAYTKPENRMYELVTSPACKSGDATMRWKACDYNNKLSSGDGGLYVDDGYLYLKEYSGQGTTPVTGKQNFKIDIELEYTYENNIGTKQRYCTIQLANDAELTKSSAKLGTAGNTIAQDAFGQLYVGATAYGSCDTDHCVSPYSANMKPNKIYHYILTYVNKTLKSYVTDEDYNVMQDVVTVENVNIDTNSINSIALGDDNKDYYFKNTTYHNIKFYEGKTTAKKPVDSSKSKYLFAYFTGNNGNDEKLHLAVSTDGLQWKTLNKNYPVWNGTSATNVYPNNTGSVASSTHIRDPYFLRGQDGNFYALATDLDTVNGTSWGNNSKLHVFKMSSLTGFNSAEHWDIDMNSTMSSIQGGNTIRAWAPQAIYDPEVGHYMLYWSSATSDYGTTSMYYVYTDDFKTFLTTPKRLISPIGAGDNGDNNNANIDGDITYDGQFYYLWYKNEQTASLAVMTSESPSGPYTNLKSFTYGQALEGPQVYQLQNGKYVLLADAYNNYHYRAFVNDNIGNFTASNEDNNTNINSLQPRHGAVIQISDAEYNELVSTYGIDADDGIIRYEFSLDHYYNDGKYRSAIWEGNQYQYDIGYRNDSDSYAQMGNGKAVLYGNNLFINDTAVRDVIQNPEFTFSFKFKLTKKSATDPTIFATCSSESGNTDYVRLTQNGVFTVNGQGIKKGTAPTINVGEEHIYTLAFSGVNETAVLLVDGQFQCSVATGAMNNTAARFVGLGYSDQSSAQKRIYGEYSELSFQKSIPSSVRDVIEANTVDESQELIDSAQGSLTADVVSNIKAENFTVPGKIQNVATDKTYDNGVKGYNSLAYSSNTTQFAGVNGNNNSDYRNSGYIYWKIAANQKTVMVYYSDENKPYAPIVLEIKPDRSGVISKTYYTAYYCYFSPNNNKPFDLKQSWKGCTTTWSSTDLWTNIVNSSDNNKRISGVYDKSNDNFYTKDYYDTSTYLYNMFVYTGNGDTTNYYEKYSGSIFRVGTENRDTSSKDDYPVHMADSCENYILNYKPLYDILADKQIDTVDGKSYNFHSLYAEVSNNEKKYTKESIIAYYNVIKEIKNCRIQGWFENSASNSISDDNVGDKVVAAANQIKGIKQRYDAAVAGLTRQYRITFHKAVLDGGSAIRTKYISVNTPDYLKAAYVKDNLATKNTKEWYDEEKHYTYNWNNIADVADDVDFYENRVDTAHSYNQTTAQDGAQRFKASTCTETGFYYNVCDCAYEYQTVTDALGHDYQSTEGSSISLLYVAPTCTDEGFYKMVCSRCDDSYDVALSELGHEYTGEVISNEDGTHKFKCARFDACGSISEDEACNFVTDEDGVTSCSVCGFVLENDFDLDAYNNAVTQAEDSINNTIKYTKASREALTEVLANQAKALVAAKSQDDVDACANAIIAANNLKADENDKIAVLVLQGYKVSFYKQIEGNSTLIQECDVPYGTVKQFEYETSADEFIEKWKAEWKEGEEEKSRDISTGLNSTSYTVYGETVITAYVSSTQTEIAQKHKVILVDKNDNVIDIAYVQDGSTFTKSANVLTIDGNNLVAYKYPYYQITDFCVKGTKTVVTDNNFAVTDDIVIKPVYTAEPQINITTTADDVTINNQVCSKYVAKWDQTITVYNASATAWYADGILVATGDTYKFQATKSVNLTYDSAVVTEGSSRIDYAKYEDSIGKFRVVVSNCIPNNAKLVEQGILLLSSSKTAGVTVASKKVIDSNKKYIAFNTTDTKLQFMYSLTTASTINTIAVVSFVTYEIDGVQHTSYSSTGDDIATMISKNA